MEQDGVATSRKAELFTFDQSNGNLGLRISLGPLRQQRFKSEHAGHGAWRRWVRWCRFLLFVRRREGLLLVRTLLAVAHTSHACGVATALATFLLLEDSFCGLESETTSTSVTSDSDWSSLSLYRAFLFSGVFITQTFMWLLFVHEWQATILSDVCNQSEQLGTSILSYQDGTWCVIDASTYGIRNGYTIEIVTGPGLLPDGGALMSGIERQTAWKQSGKA